MLVPEDRDLIRWCGEHGTGVVSYSPLGAGLLTGRYTREPSARGDRRLAPRRGCSATQGTSTAVFALVDAMRPIAERARREPRAARARLERGISRASPPRSRAAASAAHVKRERRGRRPRPGRGDARASSTRWPSRGEPGRQRAPRSTWRIRARHPVEELDRQPRLVLQGADQRPSEQAQDPHRGHGGDRRRPRAAVERRELAEEVARQHLADLLAAARDLRPALQDHEQRLAEQPLLDDLHAGGERLADRSPSPGAPAASSRTP